MRCRRIACSPQRRLGSGCSCRSARGHCDLLRYTDAGWPGIPAWLICLWILFATTFMHALSWLTRYLWLAFVSAAVLGPASYWLGSEMSDASLGTPILTSLIVMAAGWAILFPSGIYLTRRYQQ